MAVLIFKTIGSITLLRLLAAEFENGGLGGMRCVLAFSFRVLFELPERRLLVKI